MGESEEIRVGLTDEERDHREELQDEFKSESATCPECGAPIDNIRATCSSCGHEYDESEYDQQDAGTELVAGALVDDEGKERTSDQALDELADD